MKTRMQEQARRRTPAVDRPKYDSWTKDERDALHSAAGWISKKWIPSAKRAFGKSDTSRHHQKLLDLLVVLEGMETFLRGGYKKKGLGNLPKGDSIDSVQEFFNRLDRLVDTMRRENFLLVWWLPKAAGATRSLMDACRDPKFLGSREPESAMEKDWFEEDDSRVFFSGDKGVEDMEALVRYAESVESIAESALDEGIDPKEYTHPATISDHLKGMLRIAQRAFARANIGMPHEIPVEDMEEDAWQMLSDMASEVVNTTEPQILDEGVTVPDGNPSWEDVLERVMSIAKSFLRHIGQDETASMSEEERDARAAHSAIVSELRMRGRTQIATNRLRNMVRFITEKQRALYDEDGDRAILMEDEEGDPIGLGDLDNVQSGNVTLVNLALPETAAVPSGSMGSEYLVAVVPSSNPDMFRAVRISLDTAPKDMLKIADTYVRYFMLNSPTYIRLIRQWEDFAEKPPFTMLEKDVVDQMTKRASGWFDRSDVMEQDAGLDPREWVMHDMGELAFVEEDSAGPNPQRQGFDPSVMDRLQSIGAA